jgi:hypothetical protein
MATKLKPAETVEDALEALKPQLAKLREPFPANQISKLPKPLAKREVMDTIPKAKCQECGGYHATSKIIHLDYVGHAALTDRLLDTDLEWSWEPVAFTAEGLPALDRNGGLWIKLTVCGVTRYGYGSADGKSGGDAVKELIGDALRNAAMRFGAALDLWHKGDLHAEGDESGTQPPKADPESDGLTDGQLFGIMALAKRANISIQTICEAANVSELKELSGIKAASIIKKLNITIEKMKPAPAPPGSDILDDEIPY